MYPWAINIAYLSVYKKFYYLLKLLIWGNLINSEPFLLSNLFQIAQISVKIGKLYLSYPDV